MLKRVLFLSIGLLFVSGCLPAVDESGNGSSVLDVTIPEGSGTITDVQLSFNYLGNLTTCEVSPAKATPGTTSVSAKLKRSCIIDGGYQVTLSLTRNGKSCSDTRDLNRDNIEQLSSGGTAINMDFQLKCKGTTKTIDVSSNTNDSDSELGVNAHASFDDETENADQQQNQNMPEF